MEIGEKRDYYSIAMKNEINEFVLLKNPELEASKQNKILHGLGTKSINSIVAKHQGMVEYFEENNVFVCDILVKRHMLTNGNINNTRCDKYIDAIIKSSYDLSKIMEGIIYYESFSSCRTHSCFFCKELICRQ